MSKVGADFENARVLIIGAAGTVGHELAAQLSQMDVAELRLLDNNETELFYLSELYRRDTRVHAFLGDVRDGEKLRDMLSGIDFVFHTAALKHVSICERAPIDAVQTNILGVQNVIKAAQANNVKRVLFTSSDKAVNPTSVMGTTKLMGERMFTAAATMSAGGKGPVFGSTRFGNVAGSRGSVVPVFLKQIEAGHPITLTHRDMTRFVMTLHEAVALVIRSATIMCGGEVFIAKMPVVRIDDLAREMVDLIAPYFGRDPGDFDIITVGPRPGEKLYEELMNEEEVRRSIELTDFFVVTPAFKDEYECVDYSYPDGPGAPVQNAYRSHVEQPMTREQIREFLLQPDVLPEPIRAAVSVRGAVCVS